MYSGIAIGSAILALVLAAGILTQAVEANLAKAGLSPATDIAADLGLVRLPAPDIHLVWEKRTADMPMRIVPGSDGGASRGG